MVGLGYAFGEVGGLRRYAFDRRQVGIGVDVRGGRNIEARRHRATFHHRIVADDRAFAHDAVEQHRVEADEYVVAHGTGAVHDRAVGDGGAAADGDAAARLAMDDHAILDVGVGADDDGFHLAFFVHFVGADHGIGADEHVFLDDDPAAQNGSGVDEGGFMHDGQMPGRVFADHDWRV